MSDLKPFSVPSLRDRAIHEYLTRIDQRREVIARDISRVFKQALGEKFASDCEVSAFAKGAEVEGPFVEISILRADEKIGDFFLQTALFFTLVDMILGGPPMDEGDYGALTPSDYDIAVLTPLLSSVLHCVMPPATGTALVFAPARQPCSEAEIISTAVGIKLKSLHGQRLRMALSLIAPVQERHGDPLQAGQQPFSVGTEAALLGSLPVCLHGRLKGGNLSLLDVSDLTAGKMIVLDAGKDDLLIGVPAAPPLFRGELGSNSSVMTAKIISHLSEERCD